MKIIQDEIVDRQTILHIELEDEDLPRYVDRGYKKLVQRAKIPGFRKGKAPLHIVESLFGRESLLQESLNFMLPDMTLRAVETQGLDTTGMPRIELEELDPVKVKATVPLKPEVDLGPYQKIRIVEPEFEVSTEDVDKEIENLRKNASTWVPADRKVRLGDMVSIKTKGTYNGGVLINDDDTVQVIEKESVVPLPGFSEKLIGISIGNPIEFSLKIPDDYADTTLAGKEAQFTVTVNEVKELQLPDLDDELAKGIGSGHESLKALREKIETDLHVQAKRATEEQFKESAINALVENAKIDLPPLLIEYEIEHMVERRDRFIESMKMHLTDYLKITGKTEEETLSEMKEHSVERLNRTFALSKLAELEGIEVSSDDIEKEIKSMSEKSETSSRLNSPSQLNSIEVRNTIHESLLMKHAVERLETLAKVPSGNLDTSKPKKQKARNSKKQSGGEDGDSQT